MDVTLSFITVFANLLLLLATLLAWRMAWLTREKTAWVFIAAAASLMVMHRSLAVFHHSGRSFPAEFAAELLYLGISALMLAGIIRLGPTFVSAWPFPAEGGETDKRSLSVGEEKYQFLVNNLPAAVFKGYADWSVEFLDDRIEALLGYKKEAFAAGLKWSELILPEDLMAAKASFLRALKGDKTYLREYRVRHQNGDIRWIQERGRIFCREDGGIDFISGVFFDITESKLDKLAIQESEERYRALVENIKFGVVLIDHEYRIKMVNNAVQNNFSRQIQELVGQKCFRVFEKRSSICAHCPGRQAMASGRPSEAETEGVRDDGSRYPVRLSAFPLLEPNGVPKGFIEIVEDIAERRELQEERLRWSKLESLGLLAGGIAHDFNNILTAILGNLNLARLDRSQTGPLRESLEASEKACLQAQNLAQQLLTFAKGGAPVKRPILLGETIRLSADFACRGAQVRGDCQLDEDLWPVEADPGQISQVFQNLLLNAVQAMPTGGLVKIRAVNHLLGIENRWSLPPGKYVEVAIQDQGPGIPPEYLGKIFDPYFSTKQTCSGLGLASSYAIIKNHHGQITVESKVGHGTIFHIYLPATDRTVPPPAAERPQFFTGRGKILVMDDEAAVREVLGKMLTILGYEAIFARDGREAIQKFLEAQRRGEKIAAVILDLTVPEGMGGKEAITQLRRLDPQVKAIVSSGYSDDPVMADFSKYGFGGVIAKPYKVSDLSKLLHNLISGETEAVEDD